MRMNVKPLLRILAAPLVYGGSLLLAAGVMLQNPPRAVDLRDLARMVLR